MRLQCDGAMAEIQILDRGAGIPEAQLEAVFQPFFRLEGSRNPATGGSGLGLAIVRQLCDLYGWQIQLVPRQGGGTKACLSLPNSRSEKNSH
ncbi:periplasmic sensor signal transduction histidine kinase [endosymbiont of Riftia pachyptila (vent Ph05)]|uniref:histidine kinase n=1 Tax=endosymbiont of Riftia pachyptila (vent Ph05) TaxID=1048808 RepID=G2DHP1_9GAMM|nr:periplasmic sensor signal transduction histidine kinase [endosymbiont of Riftia pachyptila (vent Ph05)]